MTALEFEVENPVAFDIEIEPPPVIDITKGDNESHVAVVLVPGPIGYPGRDGIYWFTGHGQPDMQAIVGSHPGDYYMDLDTGEVYKLGD
jgi:hypothetical protein